MLTNTALVITSISPPNPVLTDYAQAAAKHGCSFIIVGDRKSPPEFIIENCDFWSLERQQTMDFALARIIPECHYARKNLGYLHAMAKGVEIIIETDDDNFAYDRFWEPRSALTPTALVPGSGWVNVYRYFSNNFIWPRGFPLEYLKAPLPELSDDRQELYCPIQQGLANENPDVDALYRLTYPLPQSFSNIESIALGGKSWCPFNSQNTTWFREAFPLLYLPSFCSFRMTDIWRSFIAQRICQANGWHILFHEPTVWQERNEHDLLRDFADEIPGYLNNAAICRNLEELHIVPGVANMSVNLKECYKRLIAMGMVGNGELELLHAWLEDIGGLV